MQNAVLLTLTEQHIYYAFKVMLVNIPEPLLLYIRSFGNITGPDGQQLRFKAPILPVTAIGRRGDTTPPK